MAMPRTEVAATCRSPSGRRTNMVSHSFSHSRRPRGRALPPDRCECDVVYRFGLYRGADPEREVRAVCVAFQA